MSKDVDTSSYVYLCMTGNGWGSSKSSEAAAIKACRDHMGSEHVRKSGFITFKVHPNFRVCEIHGDIYTPKDHPPITLTDKIIKRKKAA
jgi:hypothetical protein